MYCSQCGNLIKELDRFCSVCSTTTDAFAFTESGIRQVEPLSSQKAIPIIIPSSPKAVLSGRSLLIAMSVLLNLGILGVAAILLVANFASQRQSDSIVRSIGDAEAKPVRPNGNSANMVKPAAKETPARSEVGEPVQPQEQNIDLKNNAVNTMATAVNRDNPRFANTGSNAAANTDQRPVTNTGFPMYDRNGKKLRAICKDGSPSYWQFDRWATCLTKGGVHLWYW